MLLAPLFRPPAAPLAEDLFGPSGGDPLGLAKSLPRPRFYAGISKDPEAWWGCTVESHIRYPGFWRHEP